ncbi:putative translation initiation inhibitor, yjgF family [Hoeflea sp. IMCC20628]|uniref:RidA family protein n=1 Tax=Hoeflea sp. IMCC20628 TaxID=1620421 RepID=UPI00063A9A66|nr:RidA family protein [Hoeflea sp. IMCC20628]AKH98825.1 putative translation initiation inhibitor, yjgF family [Hoeflea sp. IMCC20628]
MTKKQCFGTSHVPLSPAVRAGDFVYVSGQVPVDGNGKIIDGGVGAQTTKVLENISAALALAGCELSDVVKTTVWLKQAEDFAEFNAAYAPFFKQDPPARSTAESRLMIDILVEIEAIAYKPV